MKETPPNESVWPCDYAKTKTELQQENARLREQVAELQKWKDFECHDPAGLVSLHEFACRERDQLRGQLAKAERFAYGDEGKDYAVVIQERDTLKLHLESEQNANRANVKVIKELLQAVRYWLGVMNEQDRPLTATDINKLRDTARGKPT